MSGANSGVNTVAMVSIKNMLEANKVSISALMPKHITPERLMKVALACIMRTPKLQMCTASSLLHSTIVAAELGLEPGGAMGHLYLVPFEDKRTNTVVCAVIVGYRGYIDLARRSGQLSDVEAHIVHEHDEFKIEFGLQPILRHVPCLTGDPGKPRLGYMLARLKDGTVHVEMMTWAEIMKIKARSRAAASGPWVTDEEEMAKKTVVRRGMKYLPMSSELAKAFEVDDEDVVEGSIAAPMALAADNALAQQVVAVPSPANEKAKAAIRQSKMKVVDNSTPAPVAAAPAATAAPAPAAVPGEPPDDVVLPTMADQPGFEADVPF